ncbi:MAG: hypothetical protein WC083_06820 [Candidatus Methanomethylophilaceae archaeon]
MDRLVEVIGPAPSELPLEVFMNTRLKKERERVAKSLEMFRNGVVPSWNKTRKPTKAEAAKPRKRKGRKVETLIGLEGLTIEEMRAIVEEELNARKADSD